MDTIRQAKSEKYNLPVAERLILAALLLAFVACAGLLAFNLKQGIVPDENAHFIRQALRWHSWVSPRTSRKPTRKAGTSRITPFSTIGFPGE